MLHAAIDGAMEKNTNTLVSIAIVAIDAMWTLNDFLEESCGISDEGPTGLVGTSLQTAIQEVVTAQCHPATLIGGIKRWVWTDLDRFVKL